MSSSDDIETDREDVINCVYCIYLENEKSAKIIDIEIIDIFKVFQREFPENHMDLEGFTSYLFLLFPKCFNGYSHFHTTTTDLLDYIQDHHD